MVMLSELVSSRISRQWITEQLMLTGLTPPPPASYATPLQATKDGGTGGGGRGTESSQMLDF